MSAWIAFGFFAALAVGCALISLFHRSVVHSAFALLGTLLGVAGLYLMLGADYLAVTQVLIYAGGILVLILFGLMLTPGDPTELRLARVFGGLALVGGGAALFLVKLSGAAEWQVVPAEQLAPPQATSAEIGLEFLRQNRYLLPFELASIILLMALVGAVFIARRRQEPTQEPDGGAA